MTLAGCLLKDKHLQFIESYIACGVIAQAAREVGVTPATGYQWTKRDDISGEIAARREHLRERHEVEGLMCMRRLRQVIDFGEDSDALKAIQMFWKFTGVGVKEDESNNVNVQVNFVQLPDIRGTE